MSHYDGPPIQDVYSPSGKDIRSWAYSGANWPEQDWDIFMAEPKHLVLLMSLIEDRQCPARDTLLQSLYCTVGHTDHTDPRIAAAVETAESSTHPVADDLGAAGSQGSRPPSRVQPRRLVWLGFVRGPTGRAVAASIRRREASAIPDAGDALAT